MTDHERTDSDLDLEIRFVVEYGYALAAAAERALRYPESLRGAGSSAERDRVRAAFRGFLRRTIGANTVILALLDGDSSPGEPRRVK
jgi:hypothetical protein